MTMLATTASAGLSTSCPGPIPTSAAHAERCRTCGKCGALARMFDAAQEAAADNALRIEIPGALASTDLLFF
jgi:hypothetical protein